MVEGWIWRGWVEGGEVVLVGHSCGITDIATTDRFKQAKSENRKARPFFDGYTLRWLDERKPTPRSFGTSSADAGGSL
jgi:hypothetical protein